MLVISGRLQHGFVFHKTTQTARVACTLCARMLLRTDMHCLPTMSVSLSFCTCASRSLSAAVGSFGGSCWGMQACRARATCPWHHEIIRVHHLENAWQDVSRYHDTSHALSMLCRGASAQHAPPASRAPLLLICEPDSS